MVLFMLEASSLEDSGICPRAAEGQRAQDSSLHGLLHGQEGQRGLLGADPLLGQPWARPHVLGQRFLTGTLIPIRAQSANTLPVLFPDSGTCRYTLGPLTR